MWEPKPEVPRPALQEDTHAVQVDVNPDLPIVKVQLVTIDGRRVRVELNAQHRIGDLKAIAHTLAPVSPGMRMRLYDYRGRELDTAQTIEAAEIEGTAVRCDVDVGPSGAMLGF